MCLGHMVAMAPCYGASIHLQLHLCSLGWGTLKGPWSLFPQLGTLMFQACQIWQCLGSGHSFWECLGGKRNLHICMFIYCCGNDDTAVGRSQFCLQKVHIHVYEYKYIFINLLFNCGTMRYCYVLMLFHPHPVHLQLWYCSRQITNLLTRGLIFLIFF